MISESELMMLLPSACAWAAEQERWIVRAGVPLDGSQKDDARRVGVLGPDLVRVLTVTMIPIPADPLLQRAARETQLVTPNTAGMTLGHGIFVRADCHGDRCLLVHELVHVAQYERAGSLENFLQTYLQQVIQVGYPAAPLEQEAIRIAREFPGC